MGYGFYGFDINDILVIDDIFIFCSAEHLLPIVDDNIIFYSPIKTPYFSSPEILELTTLPSEINYKCSYYSLGALVVFCLLNKYLLVGNEIKSLEEVEVILSPLYNTKIYWFIKRCLEENVDKRVLLLI
jgi:serine/threonine protein kinase